MRSRKDEVVSQTCAGVKYLMDKNQITVIHGHGSFRDAKTVEVAKGDGSTEACPFVKLACAIKEDRGGLPIAGLCQSPDRAPAVWRQLVEPCRAGLVAPLARAGAIGLFDVAAGRPQEQQLRFPAAAMRRAKGKERAHREAIGHEHDANLQETGGSRPALLPSDIRSISKRGKPAAQAAGAADQPQGRDAGGVPSGPRRSTTWMPRALASITSLSVTPLP